MASSIVFKSFDNITKSLDSIAISVPDPIAIATSDLVNAIASLTPSPIKQTNPLYLSLIFPTMSPLSCGITS